MKNLSRRSFIKKTSGAACRYFGRSGINQFMHAIKTGYNWNDRYRRSLHGLEFTTFFGMEDVRVVAVCDVDRQRMLDAKKGS
jgi:hypothetical protein